MIEIFIDQQYPKAGVDNFWLDGLHFWQGSLYLQLAWLWRMYISSFVKSIFYVLFYDASFPHTLITKQHYFYLDFAWHRTHRVIHFWNRIFDIWYSLLLLRNAMNK